MQETKQQYLQDVLETHRMAHIENLVNKYKARRSEIKEAIEQEYNGKIYNPIYSGSFAKSTAINSKFDLDNAVPFKKDSFTSLENMFNDVYNFLYDKYSDEATVQKQKVSIGVIFHADKDGDEISIDVVPGRELNQEQYSDDKNLHLYVNSQFGLLDEKSYIKTNIQAQIDHIKAKENERKVIRLLKIWKYTNSKKYKSFLLELFVIRAYNDKNITGNLWEQLKTVLEYIKDNANKDGFTLKDPGNNSNNVMDTLNSIDKMNLSNEMSSILSNIEANNDFIKIYFPKNEDFKDRCAKSSSVGYGVGVAAAPSAGFPTESTRFGK